MRVRSGGPEDFEAVLAIGDEAVAWMNARGNTMQWGAQPWTGNEKREQAIYYALLGEGARVVETDAGEVVGVLLATEQSSPTSAPEAGERELYINWLLTSRRHGGRGIGAMLIDDAKALAAERGIDLIRVDCWAGEDGNLVRVYEKYGFQRVRAFFRDQWPGMLLAMRLSEAL
jgi:ribosomal protein S18 acetylase RimI-like enzyme